MLAETWIFRRGSISRGEYCQRMENASAACYTKLQLHCNELSIQLESLHPIYWTILWLCLVGDCWASHGLFLHSPLSWFLAGGSWTRIPINNSDHLQRWNHGAYPDRRMVYSMPTLSVKQMRSQLLMPLLWILCPVTEPFVPARILSLSCCITDWSGAGRSSLLPVRTMNLSWCKNEDLKMRLEENKTCEE